MFGIAKSDVPANKRAIKCEIAKIIDGEVSELKVEKRTKNYVLSCLDVNPEEVEIRFLNENNTGENVLDRENCLGQLKNLITEGYLETCYIINTGKTMIRRYSFKFPTGNRAKWEVRTNGC